MEDSSKGGIENNLVQIHNEADGEYLLITITVDIIAKKYARTHTRIFGVRVRNTKRH